MNPPSLLLVSLQRLRDQEGLLPAAFAQSRQFRDLHIRRQFPFPDQIVRCAPFVEHDEHLESITDLDMSFCGGCERVNHDTEHSGQGQVAGDEGCVTGSRILVSEVYLIIKEGLNKGRSGTRAAARFSLV